MTKDKTIEKDLQTLVEGFHNNDPMKAAEGAEALLLRFFKTQDRVATALERIASTLEEKHS